MFTAVIKGLYPAMVQESGGEKVTVTGFGFTGASRVFFRNHHYPKRPEHDVQDYTVDDDWHITLTTPKTPDRGPYDVYVVVDNQESTTPLVETTASDGDSMRNTGTGGITRVTVPSAANQIHVGATPGRGGIGHEYWNVDWSQEPDVVSFDR
ncbi:IPT/TIG domain-containing protein [Nocardia iowensis]|uniref:IPT/TIG domain-containing protein n=1 Tax=Nocardia iowensis TaxID=204891 RepID=A0ABX8RKY3_NOCIO|nr:IPT/TIG domain-containing protein [Nocardia iowensis]QXN90250.1 IPT/TIG domain-containing protein [Nocardia iowensis]